MPDHYLIAPSILSADFARLDEQIAEVEAHGADWIHIDVMDGHFVPNLTMGQFIVETCKRVTTLPLDVHLMVETPERMLESFVAAGADHLSVHIEASTHIHRTLQRIRRLGCKAGVAINPGTPASAIEPVLHLVDIVLVMTVNPGFSGQTFLPEVMPKVLQIREWLDQANPEAVIEVDGGIDSTTLPVSLDAGAQAFVAASAVFTHPDGAAAGVQALRTSLPA